MAPTSRVYRELAHRCGSSGFTVCDRNVAGGVVHFDRGVDKGHVIVKGPPTVVPVLLVFTFLFGPLPLQPPGFVCPDHSVVTEADDCATSGNKVDDNPGGPASFPGGGGGGGGGSSSGGLLGIVHRLTGGLL